MACSQPNLTAGWASAEVIGSLAAGALLAVAFVRWELRAPEPMLPMRFFRSRSFAAPASSAECFLATIWQIISLCLRAQVPVG